MSTTLFIGLFVLVLANLVGTLLIYLILAEYTMRRAVVVQQEILKQIDEDFDNAMNSVPDLFDTRDI